MRNPLRWAGFLLLCAGSSCVATHSPSLDKPGALFLRQRVDDFKRFRTALLGQEAGLKSAGFSAYSLHRDLQDPHSVILTLECSDLGRAVAFAHSPGFMAAMNRAGSGVPDLWYGLDVKNRKYGDKARMTGGIVIARNEVRSYKFWQTCFFGENHHHPGRKYKAGNYGVYELPGSPETAIVVHEASDVSKAPAFMDSAPMRGEMESTGVTGLAIWYGVNLEEGTF